MLYFLNCQFHFLFIMTIPSWLESSTDIFFKNSVLPMNRSYGFKGSWQTLWLNHSLSTLLSSYRKLGVGSVDP